MSGLMRQALDNAGFGSMGFRAADLAVESVLEDLRARLPALDQLDPSQAESVQPAAIWPFWGYGDLALLVAQKTQGKSILALDLALACVVPGFDASAWGGALTVDPTWMGDGTVVIIDGEDSRQRWESRAANLLEGRGLASESGFEAVKTRVRYVHPHQLGLRNKWNRENSSRAAARRLIELGARLVIGDTVARLWQPEDFVSETWVNEGLGPFHEELKAAEVCSLMLAHHKRLEGNRKAVGPLGSSQQENQADILLIAERDPDKRTVKITHHKSRRPWWIDPGRYVQLGLPEGKFGYLPIGKPEKAWPQELPEELRRKALAPLDPKASLNGLKRKVVDALEGDASRGLDDDELCNQTGTPHRGSIQRVCKELVESGVLREVPGADGKRRTWELVR